MINVNVDVEKLIVENEKLKQEIAFLRNEKYWFQNKLREVTGMSYDYNHRKKIDYSIL